MESTLKKPWKPTSFGPKNVTSLTRGANRPFRCLDLSKKQATMLLDEGKTQREEMKGFKI